MTDYTEEGNKITNWMWAYIHTNRTVGVKPRNCDFLYNTHVNFLNNYIQKEFVEFLPTETIHTLMK